MATYYVRSSGSNTNNGTSAATAFLTLGKAASVVAAGDTVYAGANTCREVISLTASGSSGSVITFTADTDGAHTGDSGEVVWSAFTTNDKSAPSASACLNPAGKAFYTFTGFTFVGGTASNGGCIDGRTTAGAHDFTFKNCTFNALSATANGAAFNWLNNAGQVVNLTFDSCVFISGSQYSIAYITLTKAASAGYDPNIVFKNCFILSPDNQTFGFSGITVTTTGTGTGLPTAPHCYCNTIIAPVGLNYNDAGLSTTTAAKVYNNFLVCSNTALKANASGQITEDYNVIISTTPRSNVTAGTHSQTAYAGLVECGQAPIRGALPRMFGMPTTGSPLLGFGNGTGIPTVDLLGFNRPSGGASSVSAVGCLERSNTWGKETGTVHTGSNAISITGPGTQDFELPVDAVATTVSIYMRYDATYSGTLPQLIVTNGTECGVSTASTTVTAAANTWQQVSLSFTPASQGIVTIRVQSNDTNGGGHAYVDTFAVS